jgi:hypothetical protein
VAEHLPGGAGTQPVSVTDPCSPGQRRVHQRHGFLADVGRARRIAKVDALIEQLAQQQSLGQRGGQDQAGVGDQVLVIEADRDGVGTAAGSHLTGAFLIGSSGRFSNPFSQVNRHELAV